jgi:peptidyl-prolyl cis-trans isomerase SurA
MDRYQWGERLDAVVYNAYSEAIRNEVKALLEKEHIEIPSAKKVIEFNKEEISLSADKKYILKELAEMVQKNQDRSINLSLHPSKPNIHRMDSIMNYLEDFGVHKERIITTHDDQIGHDIMVLGIVEYSKKALEDKFNKYSGLNLKVDEGLFEKGDNKIIDLTSWQEGLYELNAGNRYYLVEVRKVLPPESKNLEDIKGIVISDYQDYLEKEWIKELKAKYPVIINENERKKIYRKLKAI